MASYAFDRATALVPVSKGRFSLRLSPGWGGPAVAPFGGFTAAIALKAIATVLGESHPDVFSAGTEFFGAPPADSTVEAEVRVLKTGKSFATAICILSQVDPKSGSSAPFASTQATFGRLPYAGPSEALPYYSRLPSVPPPGQDACDARELFNLAGWSKPSPPFADNYELVISHADLDRLGAAVVAARSLPSGDPRRLSLGEDGEVWIRTRDGRPWDCAGVAAVTDFLGSLNYGIRFMVGGSDVPAGHAAPHSTISFSVHFFAPPRGEWLRIRQHMTLRRGTTTEYEVAAWGENGEVVAVGRQVALARPIPMGAMKRGKGAEKAKI
ncbi:thioesterase-like superfamily-domain-containing protein [Hyaloraphidium curvatum]|nr:thioesterase-like superfamily-domain-containing protein [Hyaloraphidium curvatum]